MRDLRSRKSHYHLEAFVATVKRDRHKERDRRWPYAETVFCVHYICSLWTVFFAFDPSVRPSQTLWVASVPSTRSKWQLSCDRKNKPFSSSLPRSLPRTRTPVRYRWREKLHRSRTPLRDPAHNVPHRCTTTTIAGPLFSRTLHRCHRTVLHTPLTINRIACACMYLRARKRARIIDGDNAISGWRISDNRGTATCSGVQKRPYCTGRKRRACRCPTTFIHRTRSRSGYETVFELVTRSAGLDLIHFGNGLNRFFPKAFSPCTFRVLVAASQRE